MEVVSAAYAFGGAKWHLKCKEGGGLPGAFRVGSAISLKPVGSESEMEAIGVWPARVMKVRGMELEVVLEGDGPEGIAVQHITWTVDARADERSFNAMAHALSHWVNVEDADRKRFRDLALGLAEWPESSDLKNLFRGCCRVECPTDLRGESHVLGSAHCALHGPPGTGKTRTLVAGMGALVRSGQKVLASAPSNMAVDVMVERLAEAGLNVVRLGHPMRVSDGVASRTLDARVQAQPEFGRVLKTRQDAEQRQREADRYVRNFGPEQREAKEGSTG